MFYIAIAIAFVFMFLMIATDAEFFAFFAVIAIAVGGVFGIVGINSTEPVESYESGLLAENPAGEYVTSDGYFIEANDRVELVKIVDGEGNKSSVNVAYVTIPTSEEPRYEVNGEIHDNWLRGFGEEIFTPKEYVFYVHE